MQNQPAKQHVLIVEDDDIIQTIVVNFLEQEGYATTWVSTGKDMFKVFNAQLVDLVLPDEDGLSLARQIRARSKVPIIIMTSRQGMDDRLAGLDIGADDFLTKPFDPRELVLRVRNVLRRTSNVDEGEQGVVRFDGWELSVASRTLICPSGENVALTAGEFYILCALALAQGRVLSRDHLLDAVINDDAPPIWQNDWCIRQPITKKIEKDSRNPTYIITVPGYGYKFSSPT